MEPWAECKMGACYPNSKKEQMRMLMNKLWLVINMLFIDTVKAKIKGMTNKGF